MKQRIFLLSLLLPLLLAFEYKSPIGTVADGIQSLVSMNVLCPPGKALLQFQLQESSDDANNIYWGFDCVDIKDLDWKNEIVSFTNWDKHEDGMIWIDRHFVDCDDGFALRGFQLELKGTLARFRYNCYPVKSVECHPKLSIVTGWKVTKGTVADLKTQFVKSYCRNCPINGFQMEMKYDTSVRPEVWYDNINYSWCVIRESFEDNAQK